LNSVSSTTQESIPIFNTLITVLDQLAFVGYHDVVALQKNARLEPVRGLVE